MTPVRVVAEPSDREGAKCTIERYKPNINFYP
jgi:hypothetical protein